MTPNEVLRDACSRFMVLYYNKPEKLERLLRQALGKFQDKAGVILERWQEETTFSLPDDFRTTAGCCDTKRRFIPYREYTDDNNQKVVEILTDSRHESPYCLMYFCNLRDWPLDAALPGDCAALLCDYLEALIALHNTKLERESYLDMDTREAASTLPSDSELKQRIAELEQEMEDNKAIAPPASMF